MLDSYNRHINYLRISVTDKCNLRCKYCMPVSGVPYISHNRILSLEEITEFTSVMVSMGVNKVRLTGGEPLVRRGIVDLVRMLAQIEGINDLSMTTNGTLLSDFAEQLSQAGLNRVNISLDTTDANRYKIITRGGDITDVFRGIEAAVKYNLNPIKINCVINSSSSEDDARSVAKFAKDNDLEVRFIHKMNLVKGYFRKVEGGEGGDCGICNRIRLTSTGDIKPCLFSDNVYNIRDLGVKKAIELAINNKPERGVLSQSGTFYNVGG